METSSLHNAPEYPQFDPASVHTASRFTTCLPKVHIPLWTIIPAFAIPVLLLNSCDKPTNNSTPEKVATQREPQTFSLPELAAKVSPSVFLLEVRDKNSSIIGTGSGFVINEKGWMVTNRHVIENAYFVTAKAESGARYDAVGVVAFDLELDLVVLQLNAKNLPCLSIQGLASNPLNVGEAVAVIGSPLGLEGTLSNGIISALRAESSGSGAKVGYIQITAPISPGSSGSPVLRMNGEVIGIATLASKAGIQNLNFAVPAERINGLITTTSVIEFSKFKAAFFEQQISSLIEFTRFEEARKDHDQRSAHKYAKVFVERFPENPKAYSYLGETLTSLGLHDEATKAIRKSLEIDPDSHEELTKLGWIQLIQKLNERAIETFRESIKLCDADAAAWHGLGRALRNLNRYNEASEALKKSVAINPTMAFVWSDLGECLIRLDLWDSHGEAQAALEKAVSLDSANLEALQELGNVCVRKNRLNDAIKYYRKFTDIDPKRVETWQKLGDVLKTKGLLDEAENAFRKAVEVSPESYDAFKNLGQLLRENNKPEDAIIMLQKALKMEKRQDDAYIDAILFHELGQAYTATNQFDKAIESLLKSLKIHKNGAWTWCDLGIAYARNNKPDDAIKAFAEFEKITASDAGDVTGTRDLCWSMVVSELEKEQNKESSYLLCKRAIEIKSANDKIWYLYGKSLSYKGLDREAVSAYQKSLEASQKESNAWCGLGFSLFMTDQPEKALQALRKAVELRKAKIKEWNDFIIKEGRNEFPSIKNATEIWDNATTILRKEANRPAPNNAVKELLELMLEYNK